MKLRTFVAAALAAAISAGVCQAAPVTLYRIDIKPGINAYRFAADNGLPAYHIGQSLLLAGAPADDALRTEVVSQCLVYRGDTGNLRWVHSRRNAPAPDASLPRLFEAGGLLLVRSGDLGAAKDMAGLMVTSFPGKPIPVTPQAVIINPGLALDPAVAALAQQVTVEHFTADVESLQAFNTRSTIAPNHPQVTDWVKAKFQSFGIADVEIDSFVDTYFANYIIQHYGYSDSVKIRNVIATIPGLADSHTVYVAGGHYDTSVWPYNPWAPGADDNGSGTAAAFEMARILAANPPAHTVKLVAFDCEEWGLYGSERFASDAVNTGMDIGCMLNFDMISSIGNTSLFVSKVYPGSEAFAGMLGSCAAWYGRTNDTDLVATYNSVYLEGSDSWNFYSRGFPATYNEEYSFSPVYHQVNDSTTYMNLRYGTSQVRAGLGLLATLANRPARVSGLAIQDIGDGSSLRINWPPSAEPNVAYYREYIGRSSGNYFRSDTTLAAADTITGLDDDSLYYIGLVAVDNAGRESPIVLEDTGRPRSAPLAPAGLTALPIPGGVQIRWRQSQELDLAGYRAYQSADGGAYDSLNAALLADTSFTDSPLSGAHRYYYKVRAFDNDGNAGPLSDSAYGRPATLDQGILVVDETQNWTSGNWPRDTAQDRFYDSVLVGFPHQQHDFGALLTRPVLSDLVAYSTILWHGDDAGQPLASNDTFELRQYLDYGGRLWLVGWKPLANLRNNTGYPGAFIAGDFIYDYFGVSGVNLSGSADSLQGVTGTLGYPNMAVDASKYPASSWGGVMRNIESYVPAPGASDIYYMDMRNNASPFEGAVCGVRNLGTTHKTVLFGFPLYFMDMAQARLAAAKVMADFGETGVESGPSAPLGDRRLKLEPCAPNPFRSSTLLGFQVPQGGWTELAVYNVSGQKVRTLVTGHVAAGLQQARWDGMDDHGACLPGGVYFARLRSAAGARTIRMTLIR